MFSWRTEWQFHYFLDLLQIQRNFSGFSSSFQTCALRFPFSKHNNPDLVKVWGFANSSLYFCRRLIWSEEVWGQFVENGNLSLEHFSYRRDSWILSCIENHQIFKIRKCVSIFTLFMGRQNILSPWQPLFWKLFDDFSVPINCNLLHLQWGAKKSHCKTGISIGVSPVIAVSASLCLLASPHDYKLTKAQENITIHIILNSCIIILTSLLVDVWRHF